MKMLSRKGDAAPAPAAPSPARAAPMSTPAAPGAACEPAPAGDMDEDDIPFVRCDHSRPSAATAATARLIRGNDCPVAW